MHVPFKGAGEATVALLSGTVDFQIASIPGVIGQVKGNKLTVLAVSGAKRLPALANVPTFARQESAGLASPTLLACGHRKERPRTC